MNGSLDLAFALGGGLGAVARHALGRALPQRAPLATLLVNVLGSLLLGIALVGIGEGASAATEELRRALVGFCGGFTTFSSFAVQSVELVRERSARGAALNVALNVVLCVAAFWAPFALLESGVGPTRG